MQQILAQGPARDAIEQFFREIVGDARNSGQPSRGCMGINQAVEMAPRHPEVRSRISGDFAGMEELLANAIERGQAEGSIGNTDRARNLARLLVLAFPDLQVMARAGSDETMASPAGELLGKVCGILFRHPDEKTVYLAGDTVWNKYVADSLAPYQPDVAILNAGDARIPNLGAIIMGKRDVYEVHRAAPQATLIAPHMESVNHATLSRDELRRFAVEKGMVEQLLVPEDGETCAL